MLRVLAVAALVVALVSAGLGVYDHQHIQRTINRDKARASAAIRARSRLHKQEDKQQSRDILFGSAAGVAFLIALSAAGLTRRRTTRRAPQPQTAEPPPTTL